jgi:hypothetical protein
MSYEQLEGLFDPEWPQPSSEQIDRNFDALEKRLGFRFWEREPPPIDDYDLAELIGDLDLPEKLDELDKCITTFEWSEDAVSAYLGQESIHRLIPSRVFFARAVATSPELTQHASSDQPRPTPRDIATLAIATPEIVIKLLAVEHDFENIVQLNEGIAAHLLHILEHGGKTFREVDERQKFMQGIALGHETISPELLEAYGEIAEERGVSRALLGLEPYPEDRGSD